MKLETVAIKGGASGRLVINKADYDPKKHALWEANPIFIEADIASLSYAELREKAAFLGVTANGKAALIEKLRESGFVK